MINTHSAASANLTFLLAEPFHLLVTVLHVVVRLGGPGSARAKHAPAAFPWGTRSLMEEERAGSSLSESELGSWFLHPIKACQRRPQVHWLLKRLKVQALVHGERCGRLARQ
jgi:hypothetical protein